MAKLIHSADTVSMEDRQEPTPVLRWVFARKAERVVCELSLDPERLHYEFRTRRLDQHGSESVEHYRDATRAFRRQSDLEQALLEEGWSLEVYDSGA